LKVQKNKGEKGRWKESVQPYESKLYRSGILYVKQSTTYERI